MAGRYDIRVAADPPNLVLVVPRAPAGFSLGPAGGAGPRNPLGPGPRCRPSLPPQENRVPSTPLEQDICSLFKLMMLRLDSRRDPIFTGMEGARLL